MKLLLIQNMEYLYCSGGAHKANRLLMEQLAARGHSCCVITCLSSDYGSFRANVQEYGMGRGKKAAGRGFCEQGKCN